MKVKRWYNDGKGDIIDGNDNLEQVVGQALGPMVTEQMERAAESVKNIADVWRDDIFEEIKTCLDLTASPETVYFSQ